MENATYVALSYQTALERQMALSANNVANLNTPGFKAQQSLFEAYLESPDGDEKTFYSVNDYGTFTDLSAGPMTQTGRPLDMAVDGPGYMGINTPEGLRYTRSGQFTLNSVGEIVTPQGHRLADDGGAPIVVPEGTSRISVSETGFISADGLGVAQAMVAEFANPQALRPIGGGMLDAGDEAALPPLETKVRQGVIEGSNVNGVMEMTNMIQIMRDYQSVSRMLQSESERMRTAIQRLSGRNN